MEVNKHVGSISTLLRLLTNEDEDLLSYFDENDDSQNGNKGSSMNQIHNDNLEEVANRGKFKDHLHLEHIIGFCETSKKITRNGGFFLNLKAAHLQKPIYTTIGDNIIIRPNKCYSKVPNYIPDPSAQTMFN